MNDDHIYNCHEETGQLCVDLLGLEVRNQSTTPLVRRGGLILKTKLSSRRVPEPIDVSGCRMLVK